MKRFYLLWILLVSATGVSAQTLIGTAGEIQESGNVQLSFSIGEPVVQTSGTTTILTQGFQQVDQSTTDIPESALVDIALFPNPCRDQLFLTIDSPGNYDLRISDMAGRIILTQRDAFSEWSSLDVAALHVGLYILEIRETGSEHFQKIKFQKAH